MQQRAFKREVARVERAIAFEPTCLGHAVMARRVRARPRPRAAEDAPPHDASCWLAPTSCMIHFNSILHARCGASCSRD